MKCWLTAASYLFSSILKDESVAESVCAHSHEVDGRAVEVKKAVPRGELRRPREEREKPGGTWVAKKDAGWT